MAIDHDEAGTWAAIASGVAALFSLGAAYWSAQSAKKSVETASKNYQLNAAKEWADRVGGIQYEFELAKYAHGNLKVIIPSRFNKAGSFNSSGHLQSMDEANAVYEEAEKVAGHYDFQRAADKVLNASTTKSFAELVAQLEIDLSKIKVCRARLEDLRERHSKS
jgi:hypothetical protein